MMDKLISGAHKLGLDLDPVQIEQFEMYCRELMEWNRKVNLTSITRYEEIQIRHFLDSLTTSPVFGGLINEAGISILDVGTGAGFPGLPLKIVFPETKLALMDSTAKKTEFLHYIIHTLELRNVEIINERAEDAAHREEYRESFNVVVSRAVAPLVALVELTLPFCKPGGVFITHKKGDIEEEVGEAAKAIEVLGGSLREIKDVELEEFSDNRHLVIIDKNFSTPDKYPRRPGMPEKRPIR